MTDDARGTDAPTDSEETTTRLSPPGLDATPEAGAVPGDGDRDRVWVNLAWEGTLLVLLAGGVGLWWLLGGTIDLLQDPDLLADRMYEVAPFLLLATALAMSIRVRAVNLAVGAVAGLAAVLFLEWEGENRLVAVALVVAAAVAAGVVLSVLVAGLKVPGWAASLGLVVAVMATAATIAGSELVPVGASASGLLGAAPDATTVSVTSSGLAWLLILAVMAVSVLGGILGVLPPVRRWLQSAREAATGPDRRRRSAALTTGAALLGSCLLAAAAGLLLVVPFDSGFGGVRIPVGSLEPVGLALAFAIVLLGGTSLWGRRGGVFGTLLAALGLFAVFVAFDESGWADQSHWITVGALGLGFLVSWLVELAGGRSPRLAAGSDSAGAGGSLATAEPAGTADPAATPVPGESAAQPELQPVSGDR
ncbi:MAG: hypothetical protein GEV12_09545 [Micromonosporaceae bacterium]|nr:hypothetical protein [Micromonosporaceae bacterium]